MRRIVGIGALLLASGSFSGCGDDASGGSSPTIVATEVVGSRLLLVDSANDEVAWLDVTAKKPEPVLVRAGLPSDPIAVEHHSGSDDLLVLCRSSSDSVETDEAGVLVVVDEKGINRSYGLGTRYDTMEQSDDGRYVLLYTTGTHGDVLFSNPNDITIVDTDPGTDTPLMQRTLKTVGESPTRVVFSPELQVGGMPLRLAIILYASNVVLIDLDHMDDPTLPAYTVRLSSPAQLTQAVFSPKEGRIYLRGEASADLYMLQLVLGGADVENWFEPVLNQIGMGSIVQDVMRFDLGDGERLLAPAEDKVILVEVDSSNVTTLDLETSASNVLPFEQEGKSYAMLYGSGSTSVSFVDLSGIEDRPQHSVEHVAVSSGYSSLRQITDHEVLVQCSDGSFSVLDLYERTVAPIRSSAGAAQADDPVCDVERRRVWLAPEGIPTLGFIDLDGLQPREIRLDAAIDRLWLVPHPERPRIVVTHSGDPGYLTLVDAAEPSRKTAISLRGYLKAGVLDRGDD